MNLPQPDSGPDSNINSPYYIYRRNIMYNSFVLEQATKNLVPFTFVLVWRRHLKNYSKAEDTVYCKERFIAKIMLYHPLAYCTTIKSHGFFIFKIQLLIRAFMTGFFHFEFHYYSQWVIILFTGKLSLLYTDNVIFQAHLFCVF
jgi:hypothetical protein